MNPDILIITSQIRQYIRQPKRATTRQHNSPDLMIHTHEMHQLRTLTSQRRGRETGKQDITQWEIRVLRECMVVDVVEGVDGNARVSEGSDSEKTHEIPTITC